MLYLDGSVLCYMSMWSDRLGHDLSNCKKLQ